MYALPTGTFRANLSQQEIQVLKLLSEGATNQEMCEAMQMDSRALQRVIGGMRTFYADIIELTKEGKVSWVFTELPIKKAG